MRIELTIRTCASSPRSHSRYTVAAQTLSLSATSEMRSIRSRPSCRATRSAVVGVVATDGRAFPQPIKQRNVTVTFMMVAFLIPSQVAPKTSMA